MNNVYVQGFHYDLPCYDESDKGNISVKPKFVRYFDNRLIDTKAITKPCDVKLLQDLMTLECPRLCTE